MTEALNMPDHGQLIRLRHEVRGEVAVVHVAGEVDLVTAPRLTGELTAVEEQLPTLGKVVVDLSEVTFLASAGLQALVEHKQRCREAGVDLCVVAGGSVTRTIDITGLNEVLTVCPSLDEALEAICG